MQMRARGPGAGWSWLQGGFTVARGNPRAVLGAAALLTACMVVTVAIQLLAKPVGPAAVLVVVATALVNALLYPVLLGGFMRVLDAKEHGRPVRAWAVFDLFRPGGGGLRTAGFGLCMLVVYAAFIALLAATVGRALGHWYVDFIQHQPPLGTSPTHPMPSLPPGSSLALALVTVFFLFYSGALAIGIGQASLRRQPPLAALRDGLAGALKNALPLVVLAVCGLLALLLLTVAFGLGLAIVALVLALVGKAGIAIGIALGTAMYIVLVVLMMAFMGGVNYAIWRDVGDGDGGDVAPSPVPDPQG